MCDNKNELHKSENDKSKDKSSTRLDLDISETTDSYPEFDFLDLLRNLQIKEKDKKIKHKSNNEECMNKSNPSSEDDSVFEALAKLYEEKYGTCNDYAELGEGYDEEDSFIDNTDAVNDLVPSGIQTEFGGFYINRGKLNFVKEDNSSSSTSEDVDKFLAHSRLNARKIISDDENEEKESCKTQSNNHNSSNAIVNNNNINTSINNNNNSSNNNNHCSNNNNGSLHSNIIKSRKRSGEFQHKSKKIRKTATPKIPDHLLYKKPFPGSLEYRKNINEFKKNRLKNVGDTDKKSAVTNSLVNSSNNSSEHNTNNNYSNNVNTVHISNNNSEDDNDNDKKESTVSKKKPLTVKELLKERDGASEVIEAVATGADMADKQSSTSSDSSRSSSSDSDSDSSEDTSVEKEKIPHKSFEEVPQKPPAVNGSISKDITAKSFAHLSDNLKDIIAKIIEISKEEKSKFLNPKLNCFLLSLHEKLRELPMAERNSILDYVAEILQMKRNNITKKTKKLLVLQEESKMSTPLRKLKDAVTTMMPHLESNYFNEYTKAAGTSPQIYAELSRYYWSIDPGSLPQRKFPWNDELRRYLREIVQYKKNCYYIIRPRKESLIDFIRNFMEIKVKAFWPKEWMTVEILLEEAQVTSRQLEDKQKIINKILGAQNSTNIAQKKTSPNVPMSNVANQKQGVLVPTSSTVITPSTSRKSTQGTTKSSEVKSILIPRKTPQGSGSSTAPPKQTFPASSMSSLQNTQLGSRLQVTLNRSNVQEYLDRISGSQTSISRNSSQQISPNRSQQSVSPNQSLVKTPSPNSVLNPSAIRPNISKNVSPNSVINKSISSSSSSSSVRNCNNNSQSVLKTIEIHSNPVSGSKTSPGSVTISPVNESVFKDISPSSEVLNLTKNSSVYISKVKDNVELNKTGRSNSPCIGIPLPGGITISPTNASPSNFLSKPQKPAERNSEVKINVSITKQESAMSLTKEKRESILNVNMKREGPLQNIPDCISVTPKVVPNERHKYEHVRKRALQEYHHQQQQHSPERLKPEEKKLKTDENLLTDFADEKLDDKNFSKIFDSVIAKTTETVRQSESVSSQMKQTDRFSNLGSVVVDPLSISSGVLVKAPPSSGGSQFKNSSAESREMHASKDLPYYIGKTEGSIPVMDERKYDDSDERSENMKEQRVQMEMDRVMQNLVELSREKNANYEMESQQQHMTYSSANPSVPLQSPSFQEAFQKMLFK